MGLVVRRACVERRDAGDALLVECAPRDEDGQSEECHSSEEELEVRI